LESGLPAARSVAPAISNETMAIPMKAGGLYLTRDRGRSWERLDSDAEAGVITGIAADGHGGYLMGSKNEGILHFTPPALANSRRIELHSLPSQIGTVPAPFWQPSALQCLILSH
jgi:photosystem II stability/assembly factor-like uncharacterized protein